MSVFHKPMMQVWWTGNLEDGVELKSWNPSTGEEQETVHLSNVGWAFFVNTLLIASCAFPQTPRWMDV